MISAKPLSLSLLCFPLPHKSRGLCLANTPGLQGPVLMEAFKSRVWRGKGNAGLAWETQHLWGPRIGGFIERNSPLLGSPLHGPMLLIFRSITSMQPGSRRDAVHLLAELPSPARPLCGHHRALADPAECSASQPTRCPSLALLWPQDMLTPTDKGFFLQSCWPAVAGHQPRVALRVYLISYDCLWC